MSNTQAIETETKIEGGPVIEHEDGFKIEPDAIEDVKIEVADEKTIEVEEEAPIEIKVEEAGKPPARRLSRFDKRIKSKNEDIQKLSDDLEAVKAENELLRMSQKQAETVKEPKEEDFDLGADDPEYRTALRNYDREILRAEAREEAQKLVNQTVQNTTQAQQVEQTEQINAEHYKRADTLKIKNYDELEGNAVDILGDQFAQALIASTDNAHRILASMGASPGKTEQIARLIQSNPTKAFADALTFQIHPSLSPASKTTLDPETTVDPGRGVTSSEPGLEGVKFE